MLKKALNAVEVVTFDYPYMSEGKRRSPPKAEKLNQLHGGWKGRHFSIVNCLPRIPA